jgi:predicted transcriptional regulator of viral defense system
MKYGDLVKIMGREAYFDLASVVQLTGERRESLCMQLHRWCKEGKLLPLRRGMYAFPELCGVSSVNPAELANKLYAPSYISGYWAMGYYGLIPEKVVTFTSVTSRVTRSFSNSFGEFKYQSIKKTAFFGYRPVKIGDRKVVIAEPEKALLDMFYLEKGAWGRERIDEMRFQNPELIDQEKLCLYGSRYRSPRLAHAVAEWLAVIRADNVGSVEL